MIFELRTNALGDKRIFPAEASEPEWAWREDDRSHFPTCLKRVEAESWVQAKQLLELPMTPIQAKLATKQISHFELFGRHWAASDATEYNQPRRKT